MLHQLAAWKLALEVKVIEVHWNLEITNVG